MADLLGLLSGLLETLLGLLGGLGI